MPALEVPVDLERKQLGAMQRHFWFARFRLGTALEMLVFGAPRGARSERTPLLRPQCLITRIP
jgi:hypothetical protein